MKIKHMTTDKPPSYNVIPFIRDYSHISIDDLENILESLDDMEYLSKKGQEFRKKMWEKFIRNYKENEKGGTTNFGGTYTIA